MDNQDASDCNMKGLIMGSGDNGFGFEALYWNTAERYVRDIIEAAKSSDNFKKGSMAHAYAAGIFAELLVFFKDEKIINDWDVDELTDLLDSMCEK